MQITAGFPTTNDLDYGNWLVDQLCAARVVVCCLLRRSHRMEKTDMEDAMQEAAVALCDAKESAEQDCTVVADPLRIIENAVRRWLRKERRACLPAIPEHYDTAAPVPSAVSFESAEAEDMLERLPADEALLLRKRFLLGFKLRELAAEYGVCRRTIENRIASALASLRQLMGGE